MTFSFENIQFKIQNIINEDCKSLIKKICLKYDLCEKSVNEYIFENVDINNSLKKRGRKKKNNEKFINVYTDVINGKKFFVDEDNIVYNNNINKPLIIGKINKNGEIENI